MRKSPALPIAVALSGALSVVLAIALGAGHAPSSSTFDATARLAATAHAIVEGARGNADRVDLAQARPLHEAAHSAFAATTPALPALLVLPEIAAVCASSSTCETTADAPSGRGVPCARSARGPPRSA